MEKRSIRADGLDTAMGPAGTVDSTTGRRRGSAAALRDLRAALVDQHSLSAVSQMELFMQAVATAADRAAFIADPVSFAHVRGVDIDIDFARVMRAELRNVEAQAVAVIDRVRADAASAVSNSPAPNALPVVVAVAAVAAVVNTGLIFVMWKNPS